MFEQLFQEMNSGNFCINSTLLAPNEANTVPPVLIPLVSESQNRKRKAEVLTARKNGPPSKIQITHTSSEESIEKHNDIIFDQTSPLLNSDDSSQVHITQRMDELESQLLSLSSINEQQRSDFEIQGQLLLEENMRKVARLEEQLRIANLSLSNPGQFRKEPNHINQTIPVVHFDSTPLISTLNSGYIQNPMNVSNLPNPSHVSNAYNSRNVSEIDNLVQASNNYNPINVFNTQIKYLYQISITPRLISLADQSKFQSMLGNPPKVLRRGF